MTATLWMRNICIDTLFACRHAMQDEVSTKEKFHHQTTPYTGVTTVDAVCKTRDNHTKIQTTIWLLIPLAFGESKRPCERRIPSKIVLVQETLKQHPTISAIESVKSWRHESYEPEEGPVRHMIRSRPWTVPLLAQNPDEFRRQ